MRYTPDTSRSSRSSSSRSKSESDSDSDLVLAKAEVKTEGADRREGGRRDAAWKEREKGRGRGQQGSREDANRVHLLTRDQRNVLWREVVAVEAQLRETVQKLDRTERQQQYMTHEDERREREEAKQKAQAEKQQQDEKEKEEKADEGKEREEEEEGGRKENKGGEQEKEEGEEGRDGKENEGAGRAPPRPLRTKGEVRERGRRMFAGLLGILKTEKAKLEKEEKTTHKRQEFLLEVAQKNKERFDMEAEKKREETKVVLEETRKSSVDLIQKLRVRVIELREEWKEMLLHENEMAGAHFLETPCDPPLLWLPSKHTPATRRLLEARKSARLEQYKLFRSHFDSVLREIEEQGLSKQPSHPPSDLPTSLVPTEDKGDSRLERRKRHGSSTSSRSERHPKRVKRESEERGQD